MLLGYYGRFSSCVCGKGRRTGSVAQTSHVGHTKESCSTMPKSANFRAASRPEKQDRAAQTSEFHSPGAYCLESGASLSRLECSMAQVPQPLPFLPLVA